MHDGPVTALHAAAWYSKRVAMPERTFEVFPFTTEHLDVCNVHTRR